jgi:hypothetical protein
MNIKNNGHIKFYLKDEFDYIFKNQGFKIDSWFYNIMDIFFPEKQVYIFLASKINKEMSESYKIKIIDNKVYLQLKILNISYLKE